MLVEMSNEEATVLVACITSQIKEMTEDHVGPEVLFLDGVRNRLRQSLTTSDRGHFERWMQLQTKKLNDMKKEGEQLRLPLDK